MAHWTGKLRQATVTALDVEARRTVKGGGWSYSRRSGIAGTEILIFDLEISALSRNREMDRIHKLFHGRSLSSVTPHHAIPNNREPGPN